MESKTIELVIYFTALLWLTLPVCVGVHIVTVVELGVN